MNHLSSLIAIRLLRRMRLSWDVIDKIFRMFPECYKCGNCDNNNIDIIRCDMCGTNYCKDCSHRTIMDSYRAPGSCWTINERCKIHTICKKCYKFKPYRSKYECVNDKCSELVCPHDDCADNRIELILKVYPNSNTAYIHKDCVE